MTADRYVLLVLQKGATIHECRDCGAITFHRAVHDAWHAVNEQEANAVAALLARLVELHEVEEAEAVEVAYLDAYTAAQLTAHHAIREYRSDARRN